jgi:hypothetical protein
MKKLLSTLAAFTCLAGISQDYTLSPTNLDVSGNPGDFMLSTLIVNNPTSSEIMISFERIEKNLPPNWTSCFCFPDCIAPWIDTMTFVINPFSCDSIKPNYGTDLTVPGIGYITIILHQVGYESIVDTVHYSGSTLPAGTTEPVLSPVSVYPNPFAGKLFLDNSRHENFSVAIFDVTGQLVFSKEHLEADLEVLELDFLSPGVYFLRMEAIGKPGATIRLVRE